MGQVIIRNIDDAVLESLKARAERQKKPLEQSLREVLAATARDEKQAALARLRAIRDMGPETNIDATTLIREDRDR